MSTILDALRKSERERMLVRGVGFGDAGRRWKPERDYRPWIVGGVVVLVLAMSAVFWWILRRDSAPMAAAPAAAVSPPPVSAPRIAHSLPAPNPSVEPALDPNAQPAPASAKFLSSLPQDFQARIPPMNVTIHVYTPDPAGRMLYINNREFLPGQHVEGGVMLEDIVPDGALMQYGGRRFKLPRPR